MLADGVEHSNEELFIKRYFSRYCVGLSPIIRLKHRRHSRSLESMIWAISFNIIESVKLTFYCNFITGDKRRAKVNANPSLIRSGIINGITHQARTIARLTVPFV